MAEIKEYIAKEEEGGSICISEEVIASIAAVAALEIDGVASLGGSNVDISELLGKKSSTKGVKIQLEGDAAEIAVSIAIKKGYIIPTVAKAVQKNVISAVESMTGLKASAVNVKVTGVVFEKEPKKKKTEATEPQQ